MSLLPHNKGSKIFNEIRYGWPLFKGLRHRHSGEGTGIKKISFLQNVQKAYIHNFGRWQGTLFANDILNMSK